MQDIEYTMGKASWCFMTDKHVVKSYSSRSKKTVKPARGSIYDCWLREVLCLERVFAYPNFPQLLNKTESDYSLHMTNVGESLFHTWHERDLTKYIEDAHCIADTLEEAQIKYFYPGMDPASKSKEHHKFPLSNFCIKNNTLHLIDFEMALPVDSKAEIRLSDRLTYLYQFHNPDHFRESLVLALKHPRMSYESELMAKLVNKDLFESVKNNNPREQWESMTLYTSPPEKVLKQWQGFKKRYNIND